MAEQTKRTVLFADIEPSTLRELRRLAKSEERSVAFLVRQAVREFLDRREGSAA